MRLEYSALINAPIITGQALRCNLPASDQGPDTAFAALIRHSQPNQGNIRYDLPSNFISSRLKPYFLLVKISDTSTILYYSAQKQKFKNLFNFFYLYQYSLELENSVYQNKPAEYAWFISLCMIFTTIISIFFPAYLLNEALVMIPLSYWCIQNYERSITVMFGIKMKAYLLPFFVMFVEFISGGGNLPHAMVFGYTSTRIYHYLNQSYPLSSRVHDILKTPQLYHRIFRKYSVPSGQQSRATMDERPGASSFNARSSSSSHYWGSGKKLS
ncbi:hypothetical protein BB560_002250 [Smittium megazygosporum]|uniref:Derlin n=1 Tax=Smittium megazygosporum TaxID=133381 RepID=A0A2T9Z825_9FUNG|nr:hypothetical protein BB560_005002 [Smittium megazygosporum]PVV00749.1 hypothetical protein BB560_004856 [Smittium megazygosporum]PVV03289.1 hypothetical protein BB560_002250 [Smittium megazygosporum]